LLCVRRELGGGFSEKESRTKGSNYAYNAKRKQGKKRVKKFLIGYAMCRKKNRRKAIRG